MGLAILKCDAQSGSSLIHYLEPTSTRDIELECILEAGSYLVVPRTFGIAFSNLDTKRQELLSKDGSALSQPLLALVNNVFKCNLGP